MFSGHRPDTTRTYLFEGHYSPRGRIAVDGDKWLDMAGTFKRLNYKTYASGKLYHWRDESQEFDKVKWPKGGRESNYRPQGNALGTPNASVPVGDTRFFHDEAVVDDTFALLDEIAQKPEENFFLAVGFHQPHAPWHMPMRFWNLYENTTFTVTSGLPPRNVAPLNICGSDTVAQRKNQDNTITSYQEPTWKGVKIPSLGMPFLPSDPDDPFRPEPRYPYILREEMVRLYSASISFMDFQFGRIVDQLEKLGLENDTVIAYTSDHGHTLGDNSGAGKSQLLETSAAVPLIFYDPSTKDWTFEGGNGVSDEMTESVDVFPTLLELAVGTETAERLTMTPSLDGSSLVKYMVTDAGAPELYERHKKFAITQYMRCAGRSAFEETMKTVDFCGAWGGGPQGWENNRAAGWVGGTRSTGNLTYSWTGGCANATMGYSIRTMDWRYNVWLFWNSSELSADWKHVFMEELYEHGTDDEDRVFGELNGDFSAIEVENVVSSHPEVASRLFEVLKKEVMSKTGKGDKFLTELYPPPDAKPHKKFRIYDKVIVQEDGTRTPLTPSPSA